jgi:hypothetical protein
VAGPAMANSTTSQPLEHPLVPWDAQVQTRARSLVRPAWTARGLWLGAIAFPVALLGTLLLRDGIMRNTAELLLLGAGLMSAIAWGSQRWAELVITNYELRIAKARSLVVLDWYRALRFLGLGITALTIWQANQQYLLKPYEPFGWAGWLWLASMVFVVAFTAGWPKRSSGRSLEDGTILAERAPSSLPVRIASQSQRKESRELATRAVPRWTRVEALAFVGIVALAFFLRLWDLTSYPYAIHNDEILTGRVAIQNFVTANSPMFGTQWEGIDLPALWFALIALSLKIGNFTLVALRTPAALFGAATVIPFYGMVRSVWGRAAAIAGSTILAFSAADVHFSRVTLNNIVTPFFWTVCFFFLLRGLRLRRPADWALAGLAGGLSEYFYYGTRLLPFVLAVFALYLLIVHWRHGWRYLGHFGLLALGYLAGFGPLLADLSQNKLYFVRGSSPGVLQWDHIPGSWEDLQAMWNTLWPLMSNNLLGISTIPGLDTVYWAPMLLTGEAALLVLGVALLIWKWRHPAAFLMLLSGFGVLFVGGTLVNGTPFIAHWTPAFPAFYAAIAVPIGAWVASHRVLSGRLRSLALATVAVGVLALGLLNADFYLNHYYIMRPEAELATAQTRWEAALGTDYRIYNVGNTWQQYRVEYNQYLIKGQEGSQIFNPAAELPPSGASDKGLAFIFFPDNEQYRQPVREILPGGTDGEIMSQSGIHLFYTYVLTPQQVQSLYGVHLEMSLLNGTQLWSGKVRNVGVLAPGIVYPMKARWSGAVYIKQPGDQMQLMGGDATLLVDGQPFDPTNGVIYQLGWHQIVVEATISSPAVPRLTWRNSGGVEVPTSRLWPEPVGAGLLGATRDLSQQVRTRVDPYIGFSLMSSPGIPGPGQGVFGVQARWQGELNAGSDGQYTFEVRTDGQTRLYIDGKPVIAVCSTAGEVFSGPVQLQLSVGWHKLQLDYFAQPGPNVLELYWQPPSGVRALVPPSALRYATGENIGSVAPPAPPNAVDCTPVSP